MNEKTKPHDLQLRGQGSFQRLEILSG
jgi:hypothetical protein